ncbi:unnamed protein product [Amoebophrya sp. A120]|nr:unnamed protein product [Amoebophrya sp. A120]|eukprot:GSA120T00002604001.1
MDRDVHSGSCAMDIDSVGDDAGAPPNRRPEEQETNKRRKIDDSGSAAGGASSASSELPATVDGVRAGVTKLRQVCVSRLGLDDATKKKIDGLIEDFAEFSELDATDLASLVKNFQDWAASHRPGAREEFVRFGKLCARVASATGNECFTELYQAACVEESLLDQWGKTTTARTCRKWRERFEALCAGDPHGAQCVLREIRRSILSSASPGSELQQVGRTSDETLLSSILEKQKGISATLSEDHVNVIVEVEKKLTYASFFAAAPSGPDDFRRHQAILKILRELEIGIEAREAEKVNEDLIPELKKLHPGLARKWVSDAAKKHAWVQAGEDFHDRVVRQQKLCALQKRFFCFAEVTLSDYNRVTHRYSAEQMRQCIRAWLASPQASFKTEVLPIILNILKRGEAWDEFLAVGIDEVKTLQDEEGRVGLSALWTAKSLFCIVCENAEPGVRFRLLRDFRDSLPLLHPSYHKSFSGSDDGTRSGTSLLTFNADISALIPKGECRGAVISFGIGENSPPLGKSGILNTLFRCNFEESSRNFATYGTCDVDLGFSFKPRRDLVFGDVTGSLSFEDGDAEQAAALLSFFPSWLVHVQAGEVDKVEALLQSLKSGKLFKCPQSVLVLIRDTDSFQEAPLLRVRANGDEGNVTDNAFLEKLVRVETVLKEVHGVKHAYCAGIRNLTKLAPRERENVLKFELQPLLLCDVMQSTDNERGTGEPYGIGDPQVFHDRVQKIAPKHPYFRADLVLVAKVMKTLESFRDDFYNPKALATRELLAQLRRCRQKLENPSATSDAIEKARAEEKRFLDTLAQTKMTQLLEHFQRVLQSPSRVLLMSVLAERIKRFSDDNVAEKIEARRRTNDERTALYAAGAQPGDAGERKYAAQMDKLTSKLTTVTNDIERRRISVELLWRELLVFHEHGITRSKSLPKNPVSELCNFLRVGEPFELIDGDTLQIPHRTLQEAFKRVASIGAGDAVVPMNSRESLQSAKLAGKRVMVISILGPQSSGKSTLLNYLFGCKFNTAKGRCTKGVYGSLIEITHEHYDYLLILDTEGLQSPEKLDHEFDRKITLFCLAVSHFVIINVAKDMNAHMRDLLEICLFSLDQLQKARMAMPTNFMVFNQHSGDTADKSVFMDQVKGISEAIIAAKPEAVDAARAMQFPSERIKVLPLATNSFTVPKDPARGVHSDWNQERPATKFAVEVAQFGKEIMDLAFKSTERRVATPNSVAPAGRKVLHQEDLESWIRMATDNWTTITAFPDLYRFANVKLLKDHKRLTNIAQDKEQHFLTSSAAQLRHVKEKRDALAELVGNESQLLNRDYFQNVSLKVENRIRGTYFEHVLEKIKRDFDVVCRGEQFDKDLIEQFLKHIRILVKNQADSIVGAAHSELKQKQMNQSKLRGNDKLNDLERDLTKSALTQKSKAQRTKFVNDKFEEVWKSVIDELEGDLSRGGDVSSAQWETLKSNYSTLQTLPKSLGGQKETEWELQAKLHSADKAAAGKRRPAKSESAIGPQLIERLQQKDFHFLTRAQGSALDAAAKRGLQGINELLSRSSEGGTLYTINVFDHFDVFLETRTCVLDIEKHINYFELRNQLEHLGRLTGMFNSQETERLAQFTVIRNQFSSLGLWMQSEFITSIENVLRESGWKDYVGLEGERVAKIAEILSSYSCFSVTAPASSTSTPQKSKQTGSRKTLSRVPFIYHARADSPIKLTVPACMAENYRHNTFVPPISEIERKTQHLLAVSNRGPKRSRAFKNPDYITEDQLDGSQCYCFLAKQDDEHRHVLDELQKADCPVPAEEMHRFFKANQKCWKRSLTTLEQRLDEVLRCVDSTSSGCSKLVKRVHEVVSTFLKNDLGGNFALFGVELDMDGKTIFHSFALLHVHRVLSGKVVERSRAPLLEFIDTKDKWRAHLLEVVGADPAGKTVAAAKRFVQELSAHLRQAESERAAELASPEMTELLGESFTGAAIQERLDQTLLFNPKADHDEVVRYVIDQPNVIEEEFEKKWEQEKARLQKRLVADCVTNVKRALSRVVDHVAGVLQFINQREESGTGSSRDCVVDHSSDTSGTAYYERDNQQVAAAQAQFFLATCKGGTSGIAGTHWGHKNEDGKKFEVAFLSSVDPQSNGRSGKMSVSEIKSNVITTWGSISDVLPSGFTISDIPKFELFLLEVKKIVHTELASVDIQNVDIVWGLDDLFDRTKRKAIGCCEQCPTCGRKCDQPVDGPVEHKHACRLGHQLRCMAGVTVKKNPSFLTCDEIPGDSQVQDLKTGAWRTWEEQQKKYPTWEFKYSENAADELRNVRKMRECWKIHGKHICAAFADSGMKYSDVKPRDLHIVFVVEDEPKSLQRLYEELGSGSIQEQYCSVVVSTAHSQKLIVTERRVATVLDRKAQRVKRNPADEQEALTVSELVQRSEHSYYRQKLWLLGIASWPQEALEDLLRKEKTKVINFNEGQVYSRFNDAYGKFANPYGIRRAQVIDGITENPAEYMAKSLCDFDERTLAHLPEEIGAAGGLEGLQKQLTEFGPDVMKRIKRIERINEIKGTLDEKKARKILELDASEALTKASLKAALKKVQVDIHPDRVPSRLRPAANKAFQTATAAKDYLDPN